MIKGTEAYTEGPLNRGPLRIPVGVYANTASLQKFNLEKWAQSLGDLNFKGHVEALFPGLESSF